VDKERDRLNAKEVEDAKKISMNTNWESLTLQVSTFQDRLAGARAPLRVKHGATSFARTSDARPQDKLLNIGISLCKSFNTDRIRCFDYWRR